MEQTIDGIFNSGTMNNTKRHLYLSIGIITSILGVVVFVPAVLKEMLIVASVSLVIMLFGLLLVAVAFGD